VPAPDDYDNDEIGGMIGRGNRSTRRKPAPVPLCPPQTPHAARTRTQTAAVGSQRLTAELRHGLYLSGLPQGSILGPLHFNIINDLCDIINNSNSLPFADDLKIYRNINLPSDCLILLSDTECVHGWCLANFIKPEFSKI
jgi:hypothetical protein